MSKQNEVLSERRCKVSIASNRNVPLKVSKLFSICGFMLAFGCYSIWNSSSLVAADKHTHGSIEPNAEVILNRRIIERTTSVPTNYTIIYKYVRDQRAGQISYIEFDVTNCASTGKVELLQPTNTDSRHELVVTANLHIANCQQLNATVRINGWNASISTQLLTDPLLAEINGDKLFEDKSFTLIYAHNDTRSMDRIFKLGQRQTNDVLLKTEKLHVNSEFSSFPQSEITYNQPTTFITQMQFIFNSPTATAFLNSSFIDAQNFNAIVYDLNRPEFTVKYNVYGYYVNYKPSDYKSILTTS